MEKLAVAPAQATGWLGSYRLISICRTSKVYAACTVYNVYVYGLCRCSPHMLTHDRLTSANHKEPTLPSSSLPRQTRNLAPVAAQEVKGLTRLSPVKLRMSRYIMLTVNVVRDSGSDSTKVPPATTDIDLTMLTVYSFQQK